MVVKGRAVRDEAKVERRREILDAAERLFLARPAEGLASMDELALAAGVAKGTLYLYFPSKEEVLLALHERGVHQVFDALDQALADRSTITAEEMSGHARRLLIDNPIYLPLITLVMSFIGQAIPIEEVTRFHGAVGERLAKTGATLDRLLGTPAGVGQKLLGLSHALVVGLWQVSGCGRLVPEHLRAADPNLRHCMVEDPVEYQHALNALWNGMLSAMPPAATAKKTRTAKPARRGRKARSRK